MSQHRYRDIFFAANGFGPYPCHFCHALLEITDRFIVHHADHDHDNDDPANLVAAHKSCHASHHIGKPRRLHDAATKAKISAGMKLEHKRNPARRTVSLATRRKISETLKGRDVRKEARDAHHPRGS